MKYGHLEMRIEEMLKKKGSARIRSAATWIYREQILTDIAEMSSRG